MDKETESISADLCSATAILVAIGILEDVVESRAKYSKSPNENLMLAIKLLNKVTYEISEEVGIFRIVKES
jgi:hypothetical protein